ncbi:TIGR04255 family protein [Mycobacterium sp. SMC-18]
MIGMVGSVDNAQYTSPPVRAAVFTVYIDPLKLDINLLTELRSKWATQYPGFTQSSPQMRPSDLLPEVDLFSLPWPMPAVQLANSSLSRTIAFQFDHFSLTWTFDSDGDGNQYPGYLSLASELNDRFAEFVDTVDEMSDDSVKVQGCQCHYTNVLDNIDGAAWLTDYLTRSTTTHLDNNHLDDAEHVGFRVHRVDDEDDVQRRVWLQMTRRKAERSEVTISVVAVPKSDSHQIPDDPNSAAQHLMDSAHRLENKTFEASFSDAMKRDWRSQQ